MDRLLTSRRDSTSTANASLAKQMAAFLLIVGGTLFLWKYFQPKLEPSPNALGAQHPVNRVVVDQGGPTGRAQQALLQAATEARLRELEARVATLSASGAPAPPQPPGVEVTMPADIAARRAEQQREHNEAVARHWKEPEDRRWAATASKNLRRELDEVAKRVGFDVVNMDCRTESCVAVTEWADYGAAMNGWGSILHRPYSERCGVQVMLEEPKARAARYQTTVLFMCDPAERAAQ